MQTVMGQKQVVTAPTSTLIVTPQVTQALVTPIGVAQDFPVSLSSQQTIEAVNQAKQLNFLEIPSMDIGYIGSEEEKAFGKTLDSFLDRSSQNGKPQLFKLIAALSQEIEDQDLGGLANRIIDAKPTLGDKFLGMFSKKALAKGMDKAWEITRQLAEGKTKSVRSILDKMALNFSAEQVKLYNELKLMNAASIAYDQQYERFLILTAAISMFHEGAKLQVAQLEAETDLNNPIQAGYLSQQQEKLKLVDSRLLNLTGTLTGLPADKMILQSNMDSGIKTLQETIITVTGTFNKIKTNMIALNGALTVRDMQQMGQDQANLNKNLDAVRSTISHQVAVTATTMIGDNRLNQAMAVLKSVEDVANIKAAVLVAEKENEAKVQKSREIYEQSRARMLQISQSKVN